MNTKERHLEIYDAAVEILAEVGGVTLVDSLPQDERIPLLRGMAKKVTELTSCHINSAKRNVTKAMRRARYNIAKESNWGGKRPGSGRPSEK